MTYTFTYKGETKTLKEFAQQYGINYDTLRERVRKDWDIAKAIEKPVKKRHKRMQGRVPCPYPNCDDCPYSDCRW